MMIRSVQSLASRAAPRCRPSRASVRSTIGLALGVALLSWTSVASAQGWTKDRRYTEGEGIKTGDLELHPGIGAEAGYDSNWFLRSNATGANIVNGAPNLPPRDAAVIRLTPSLYISTIGRTRLSELGETTRVEPRAIAFRAGVSATGRVLLGKEMTDQSNVGVNADARLDINQSRPLGFAVFGAYSRLIQPQVLSDPSLAFNRDDVRGGLEVVALPGGGTLDMRAGYQLAGSFYEESSGAPYTSITHEFSVKDRWKFRPRTALFSDTTLRFVNYPNASRATNYINDSTPIRTRFGITGLFSDRFGALVAAGYSATFFADSAAPSSTQYDSFNAQAEGTYYLGRGGGNNLPGEATLLLSTISVGAMRDFQTSLLGNFYTANRLYARVEYWYGGKVVVRLEGFGELLQYPPVFLNNPTPVQVTGDFLNTRIGGSLFAEYRVTSTFGLNTSVDYIQQFSGTQLPAGGPGGGIGVYDLNYNRLQAFLGGRYFY